MSPWSCFILLAALQQNTIPGGSLLPADVLNWRLLRSYKFSLNAIIENEDQVNHKQH